ncbi:hypothetical protein KUF83_30415 [Streptomyces sp. BV286]|uniref:hypothetical protein n=1 Tax=Streptomyces sp. BV286 TaxID=2849672 RepID=UPI001C2E46BA|nr:hypothetical protein [Streptomyces sp. BV286]MBV1940851.1 hypothetical protein [Streptomyces sp. BV286]
MGRHQWGKAVSAVALGVIVAAVSGCGGSGDDSAAPKPAAVKTPKTVSLDKASTAFEDAVTDHDSTGGCVSVEINTCYDAMIDLIEPARDLRKAMNADKSMPADFWTDAYVLIDTMEEGVAIGEDRGGGEMNTASNRPKVFGSAHDLVDWLAANPVK